jgi:outer membrane protein assembly factor BamB/tetratricopeptide (TPR) repeat protein
MDRFSIRVSGRMRTQNRLLAIGAMASALGLSVFDTLPAQVTTPRRPQARPNDAPPPPELTDKQQPPKKENNAATSRARRQPPQPDSFRNFGRPGAFSPPRPDERGDASDREGAAAERRGPRDSIDGRIPHNATESKHLEQAAQLMASGQPDQALEILEVVLAHSGHATIRTPDGRPGLVAWEANRLLSRLPAAQLETYRLRHEAQARELDRTGRRTGNWDQVIDVATQYFHTETGQQAANAIGNFHFDRGEFGLAALWYGRLLESNPPWSRDAKWRLKVALTYRESGNIPASEELLRQLRTEGPDAAIGVGGDSMKPDALLRQLPGSEIPSSAVLDEWLQFQGNARRAATPSGGDPLLLTRWSHASTQNKHVIDQLDSLLQDLSDLGRAAIPVAIPLTIKDRIAFRTLRDVHVIDSATGKLLWETRPQLSEDALVASRPLPFDFEDRWGGFRRFRGGPWSTEFIGGEGGADGHPLTGVLFRNPNFGLLASDGTRLFVIEDDAVIMHGPGGSGFQPIADGPEGQRTMRPGNRLAAYDLATGREVWSLGGPANGESFDLPLAGSFFFGAPLVDAGELFVIAERDLDVRLYSIDPESGAVRWSQLLAHSDNKIEQELGRRWRTAQVASSDGILVCPTTVDWLVGVDRLDHSILWMHRYLAPRPQAERREREQGDTLVQPSELNGPWCPSAPIIAGNRVLYVPAEESNLICLDLATGQLRWRYPKGEEQLYLAGLYEASAILVGKSSVTALSLEKGKPLWTAALDESQGPPSGRGVVSSGHLYLPLRAGALCTIELATGKVLETAQVLPGSKPLGNLTLYRGMMLSLNAYGLTAFEQRDAIERQIAQRQTTDPHDEWASVKRAEIALLHNDPVGALASLGRVDSQHLEPLLSRSYRKALFEALTDSVRHDYTAGDRPFERLSQLAQTGDERLLVGRLEAERAVATGKFGDAFAAFQKLAITQRRGLMIPRPDDPHVTVDFDAWIAGRLFEIWQKLSTSERARVDMVLPSEAERVMRLDPALQERFAEPYAFHPAAQPVIAGLVEHHAARKDLFRAERLLLRQERIAGDQAAAAAQLRLAKLLDERGLPDDAASAYRHLAAWYPHAQIQGGTSAGSYVDNLREAGLINPYPLGGPSWGIVELKVHRFGTNYLSNHIEELLLGSGNEPFFEQHRFSIDERRQRLEVVRSSDDGDRWMVPLRTTSRSRQGEYTVGIPAGHELVLLHRDVVHFLSPIDQRVLWTRSMEVSNGAGSEYRTPQVSMPQPLRAGNQFASRHSLLNPSMQRGMLAAANTEYVCVYGRREFTVLDAQTGEVRWKCTSLPQHATVFGNEDVIYMIPSDRNQAVAFRATDGKRLEVPKLGDLLVSTIAVTPRGLVVADGRSSRILGFDPTRTVVRLVDPLTLHESWRVEYPGGTNLTLLDQLRMLAISAAGELEIVDLQTGERKALADGYPVSQLRTAGDTFAVTDRERLYIIKSNQRRTYTVQFPEGFQRSLSVGGRITAYNLRDGKLAWANSRIPSHNLVLDFLADSPVLIFAGRQLVKSGSAEFQHWSFNLLVLDKRTGHEVLKATDPSVSNFKTLEVNMAEKYIELRSFNQRLRLMPSDFSRTGGARAAAQ